MKEPFFVNVSVCDAKEFDWQSSITYSFNSWQEAQSLIILSLEHGFTIQLYSPDETS